MSDGTRQAPPPPNVENGAGFGAHSDDVQGQGQGFNADVDQQLPVVFPTDVGAALAGQPLKLVLQMPTAARHSVVPVRFRVHCDWSDVRNGDALRCRFCRIRGNGGADEIVDLELPLEELAEAAGNERGFVETQARRRVRCFRECSSIEVLERRDLFLHTAFEPVHPARGNSAQFSVEVISGSGLPVGKPLQVTGRVVERWSNGLRFVHNGAVELAAEPPDDQARTRARMEVEPFLRQSDPLAAFTRAVQHNVTGNLLASMTDMTSAVLLAVFSPIGLPLRDGRDTFTHRVQISIVGDTGVRKSTTVADIIRVIGFGSLVGATSSIAGLVGTVEEGHGARRPRWGAIVREHRGLLAVEEGATLDRRVIAAIRDLRERGSVSIHLRGESYSAAASPAIIETCNPGMNRTLASFPMWAEALTSLSNHELADLRRFALVLPVPSEALNAAPIDTATLPSISAASLRTIAWVARTIGPDRIALDPEAIAGAEAAEAEIRPLLPPHGAVQAIANHSANKLLHLAGAWAVASQVPLGHERVRVLAWHVRAVAPLYRRTLLAWTTRGEAEALDPDKVAEIVRLLRDAARSLGRKHRLDPLTGLRVLLAAPFGLTMREWSVRVGASDKTIRDAWVTSLFVRYGLVERVSTRYRILPLGRAVIAAAEDGPPEPDNGKDGKGPHHRESGEIVEIAELDAVGDNESLRIPKLSEQATSCDSVREGPERNGELPEFPEVPGSPPVIERTPIIPPGISVEDFLPMPDDGTLRPMKVIWDDREQDGALDEAGGRLNGYTHTLNPALGCVDACSCCGKYCCAQWETPAQLIAEQFGLRWGEYLFVKKRIAGALERDLARAARRDASHPHHVSQLRIFMSSVTEPCAGPSLGVTRECLQVFACHPIGRLVLQTRSPKVIQLLPELKALGKRVVVSFTIESDTDEIWRSVDPPMLPRLHERRKAVAILHENGVTTSVTVSPCARIADPEEFAVWIAMNASYAVVDTFVARDGKGGTRTEKTQVPAMFASQGWAWSDEVMARTFFDQIRALIGDRVGWSSDGLNRLATVPIAARVI